MVAKATRAQRRAYLRSKGKRGAERACEVGVVRVLELADAGHSPKTIARSAGMGEDLVNLILSKAAEVEASEEGEGVGRW